ncbi:GNAT family N-acetyltransferase [Chryseolinea sp. H1M3-3]|uniref:GNAT family N-acetyltransferase n=1 Tax=Chryseolinea sp. H1M3-3 TaxID=3034144 RepID=UPI0023EAD340|nr:GNAT family N-acetyltransferase [Chryseolinea sp. H1M3-3]
MQNHHKICHTGLDDLPFIYQLFEHSILYQEKKGFPVWRDYDKGAIVKDIENKNQYKIIIDNTIAIVFSVAYSDKIIWRDLDKGNSIYLHRIVINPLFKGQKLFGAVVRWAIGHAREKGLSSIRMDTWAANPTIIQYYKSFGFETVENYTTPNSTELPVHNRNLSLTLLEYRGKAM